VRTGAAERRTRRRSAIGQVSKINESVRTEPRPRQAGTPRCIAGRSAVAL